MMGGVSMFEQMATAWYMGVPHYDTHREAAAGRLHLRAWRWQPSTAQVRWAGPTASARFAPGKRADLVLVRATDLNMAPLGEAHSALARVATVANVDTVICDGRVLKRGGRLVGVDVPQIVAEAEQSLAGLRSRAGPNWQPKALRPEERELAMLGACA